MNLALQQDHRFRRCGAKEIHQFDFPSAWNEFTGFSKLGQFVEVQLFLITPWLWHYAVLNSRREKREVVNTI